MRRRELVPILAGAMISPRTLRAQPKTVPVVGYIGTNLTGPALSDLAALRQGLSDAGYVEGQNVTIEFHWAEGHYDRLPALAADFVDRKVDVIVVGGTPE